MLDGTSVGRTVIYKSAKNVVVTPTILYQRLKSTELHLSSSLNFNRRSRNPLNPSEIRTLTNRNPLLTLSNFKYEEPELRKSQQTKTLNSAPALLLLFWLWKETLLVKIDCGLLGWFPTLLLYSSLFIYSSTNRDAVSMSAY